MTLQPVGHTLSYRPLSAFYSDIVREGDMTLQHVGHTLLSYRPLSVLYSEVVREGDMTSQPVGHTLSASTGHSLHSTQRLSGRAT